MTAVAHRGVDRDEGVRWVVCPGCRTLLYVRRLARDLRVCPDCGHHHRLTARARVAQLFDDGVEVLDIGARTVDVLGFTDTTPYPARLAAARAATGLDEAVVLASGTLDGHPVVAAVMDFRFLGGSLGTAVGELVTRAAELALARRVPLLLVCASGGARMQEGVLSLMQMAKTAAALGELDEAGVLTVSLVTDPTYGGVAASFATLCDVIVAEPGARLGFAGRRVIEQTIRETLPDDFQTAEYLLAHGLVDVITPRAALRTTLSRVLAAARTTPPDAPDVPDVPDGVVRDHRLLPEVEAWDAVRRARELGRPTTLDYLALAFDDFQELRGDRLGEDCPAVVGGIARLAGAPVVVVGHQKGRTAEEMAARDYGMPTPAGYRKAARLMRLAAKLGLPVVTLVDTPGAHPGRAAEERGQAVAVAESIRLMARLPVPVVTVVTGEGGSGGALALAVANEVLIGSNGVYSVISPEGCAAILWRDRRMAPAAARALRLDAANLLRLGVVDGVVPEPEGGSGHDHVLAGQRLRDALVAALRRLSGMTGDRLVAARRARFRAFGATSTDHDDRGEQR
ncbi:acetyl-CoA carboxylase carboxyltransferase subunit alpha [Saccharothrix carnea]|uniref:Multifunctional fusion protein n=1 Tax=Saccharothrix carnea TaxID=1280637 RepID=A0A2P8I2H8_SACCR|nr:acetyl-CoA carboxylase, carboxyltransferase subunit beta [Saccharothrix carnea]PSL52678.1 acetyl-CoA carboxylase carboxyltransferase subunit alpha [Saccharothrix carnea]